MLVHVGLSISHVPRVGGTWRYIQSGNPTEVPDKMEKDTGEQERGSGDQGDRQVVLPNLTEVN